MFNHFCECKLAIGVFSIGHIPTGGTFIIRFVGRGELTVEIQIAEIIGGVLIPTSISKLKISCCFMRISRDLQCGKIFRLYAVYVCDFNAGCVNTAEEISGSANGALLLLFFSFQWPKIGNGICIGVASRDCLKLHGVDAI